MKISMFGPLLLVALLANGCALFHHHSKAAKTSPAAGEAAPLIVTPDNSLAGRVLVYNSVARYVVLDFPVGRMPRQDQSLFLYRGGIKVGEIKVTGPQRDNDVVADLINGEAQVGDEVRDQ